MSLGPVEAMLERAELLEGEMVDIQEEAANVAGPGWLDAPNARLGGRTPAEMIRLKKEFLVRDLLRSMKHIGIS